MKTERYYCGMTNRNGPEAADKATAVAPGSAAEVSRDSTAKPASRETGPNSELPDEYDRRGTRLPPRARIGGIIIPQ